MNKKIFLSNSHGGSFIDLGSVLYVAAASGRLIIHFESEGKEEMLEFYSTLKDLEEKLVPEGFVRIHKCFIVNMDKVSDVEPEWITLESERPIRLPIGRVYSEIVRRRIVEMHNVIFL